MTLGTLSLLYIFLVSLEKCIVRGNDQLLVEIFYAPFDGISQDFVSYQVYIITYHFIGSYLDLRMYPIANCTYMADKLTCPYGEDEVKASLHHLCAFNILAPERDGVIDDAFTAVQYLVCTFGKPPKPFKLDYDRCAEQIQSVKGEIDDCVNQTDNKLLASAMKKYQDLNPGYFPFVVLDGKQSKGQDDEARVYFWKTLCRTLGFKGPSECKKITEKANLPDNTWPTFPPSGARRVSACSIMLFIVALIAQ